VAGSKRARNMMGKIDEVLVESVDDDDIINFEGGVAFFELLTAKWAAVKDDNNALATFEF
jgi:hypothetical protein